ncbi:MAG: hypothetical protein WCP79_14480 [Bacillota bacterium]
MARISTTAGGSLLFAAFRSRIMVSYFSVLDAVSDQQSAMFEPKASLAFAANKS